MSNAPNGAPGAPSQNFGQPRESNTMGTVGFVLSLVGLVGCCIQPAALLSLAGLILSIIGLSKRPKGLAIAGTILGVIGMSMFLLFYLIVGLSVVLIVPLAIALAAVAGPDIETAIEEAILHQQVAQYIDQTGSMPVDLTQIPDLDERIKTDPWDTPYKLEVIDVGNEEYIIRSAGPDKIFDTEDDITTNNE